MALISGVTHITDSIKMAGDGDYCYLCAKKYCREHKGASAYDAVQALKGKIAHQPVLYERTSGIDKCFCFDCLQEVIKDMKPLMPNKEDQKENK
jgi:hypothetical protein